MSIFSDATIIYKREMLIFKANARANIIRSIIFPVILIVFFGSIGSSFSNGVPVAVVNLANNAKATQFIQYLNSNPTQVAVKAVTTQQDALKMLSNGQVSVVVVVLPTFPGSTSQPGVSLYYTNSFSQLGSSLQFLSTAASYFGARASQAGNPIAKGFLPTITSASVNYNVVAGAKGDYKSYITGSVIGMVAVFGSIFGGGMSLISDRQLGNLKAFFISPINKNSIVLGKLMAGTTQSIIYGFFALGIGLLDGITIAGGLTAIIWIIVIVSIVALGFSAITIVLASRINKVEIYAIFAQVIGLPLWFVSGGLFPVSFLPSFLQPISVIDPLTYANVGIRSVIINGTYPLNVAAIDISAMLLFAAVCLVIAFKTFKGTIE